MCYKAGESTYCSTYCQEGYDFQHKPEEQHFCYQGKWNYWKGNYQVIMDVKENWSDCVGKCIKVDNPPPTWPEITDIINIILLYP